MFSSNEDQDRDYTSWAAVSPEEANHSSAGTTSVLGTSPPSASDPFSPKSNSSNLSDLTELFQVIYQKTLQMYKFDRRVLSNYVSLEVIEQNSFSESFDLMKEVLTRFIHPRGEAGYDVLLLTGMAGTGKSWFGQHLAVTLWQKRDEGEKCPLPLWIPLLSIKDPTDQLIEKHLQGNLGLSAEAVATLAKSGEELLLILDGYDEIGVQTNLYDSNNFNKTDSYWQGSIKVLITDRQAANFNTMMQQNTASFIPNHNAERLLKYTIQPFNQTKIKEAVEKFVLNETSEWSSDQYLKEIESIPELKNLISKPYLLYMTLISLPQILGRIREGKDATQTRQVELTRRDLYRAFMDAWFAREAGKLPYEFRSALLAVYSEQGFESVEAIFENYTQQLAQAMYWHRTAVITWIPRVMIDKDSKKDKGKEKEGKYNALLGNWIGSSAEIKASTSIQDDSEEDSSPDWLAPFFDDSENNSLALIRNACPIEPIGSNSWAFIHDSLLEFYAAEHLFNGVLIESWIVTGQNLNDRNLQATPEILFFLADRARQDKEFKKLLFKVIEFSARDANVWKAAANAITILNYAQISLSGYDFTGVRIGGEESLSQTEKNRFGFKILRSENSQNYAESQSAWRQQLQPNMFYLIYFEDMRRWYLHCEGRRTCLLSKPLHEIKSLQRLNEDLQELKGQVITRDLERELEDTFRRGFNDPIIQRWGADLSMALLNHSNFSQSDLRHVTFFQAQMADVILDGACVDGINLAERTALKGNKLSVALKNGHSTLFAIYTKGGTFSKSSFAFYDYPLGGNVAVSLPELKKNWSMKISLTAFALSPEGKDMATAEGKIIKIWKIHSEKYNQFKMFARKEINIIEWSPDGHCLAVAEQEGKIWILQATHADSTPKALIGHKGAILSIAWSPDSAFVTAGGVDTIVHVWKVEDGSHQLAFNEHSSAITSIGWSPSGHFIASASEDKTIKIWDMNQGVCIKTLTEHKYGVTALVWSPRGDLLATADSPSLEDGIYHGKKGIIRIWAMPNANCVQILKSHTQTFLKQLAFDAEGKRLFSTSGYKIYEWQLSNFLWTAPSSLHLAPELHHTAPVKTVCWSPDGKSFASGSDDKTIRVWRTSDKKCTQTISGIFTEDIETIDWSKDGRIASGHNGSNKINSQLQEGVIYEWNLQTGEWRKWGAHRYGVFSAAWSSDCRFLASCGNDKIMERKPIKIWDMKKKGKAIELAKQHTHPIKCIAWSPQGDLLAAGSDDMTLSVWRLDGSLLFQTVPGFGGGHYDSVEAVAWSPDGSQLVSCSGGTGYMDTSIRIWDVRTSQNLRIIKGHKRAIFSVAWSPNGEIIASGDGDNEYHNVGSVYLWHATTGQLIAKLHGYTAPVKKVTWRPISPRDCQYLLTGSENNSVYLWKVYRREGQWKVRLSWKSTSNTGLVTQNLSIRQIVGLSNESKNFFEQVADKIPLVGMPSAARSKEILIERDGRINIPEGKLVIKSFLEGKETEYVISSQQWLFGMVRESSKPMGHVWFILQGLDDKNDTDFKEIHFGMDTNKVMLFNKTIGYGHIKIHSCSPCNLEKKWGLLTGKTCLLNKESVKHLLENVEDQAKNPPYYLLSGNSGFFSAEAYNCLSWCLKQIELLYEQQMIEEKIYKSLVDVSSPNFWSKIIIMPSKHLPGDSGIIESENVEIDKKSCLAM